MMLERYPDTDDWKNVRFSDESHFGWGQQGKMRIIRKPGERYCQKCIQPADPKGNPYQKDEKRLHAWAAIGWNFRSDLVWYEMSTNTNGKLSHQAYIDQILEPAVKPWLEAVKLGRIEPFVLEEDNDSSYGSSSKRNIVTEWKAHHGLKHYFNCPHSPDLAPIENSWQLPKQILRKVPHWDDSITKSLAKEGWNKISYDFINPST